MGEEDTIVVVTTMNRVCYLLPFLSPDTPNKVLCLGGDHFFFVSFVFGQHDCLAELCRKET